MSGELFMLFSSVVGIAFVHALMGPDHFLPFVALGKAQNWSRRKLSTITLGFGLAHTLGTVLIALVGIQIGASLKSMMGIESFRGNLAAWGLVVAGFTYMVWGIKRAYKNKPHSHYHVHADGNGHAHTHNHHQEHSHLHAASKDAKFTYMPIALFMIFIFGPCEPLIPLLMFSAESYGALTTISLIGVFTSVTLGVMLGMVLLLSKGLDYVPANAMSRFSHALSGGTIGLCGAAILAFGV